MYCRVKAATNVNDPHKDRLIDIFIYEIITGKLVNKIWIMKYITKSEHIHMACNLNHEMYLYQY